MQKKEKYSDEELIIGLQEGDSKMIEYLYRLFSETAKKHFLKPYYEINVDDFPDIIQESFITFYQNIIAKKYPRSSYEVTNKVSILTYLLGIFKNILNKKKIKMFKEENSFNEFLTQLTPDEKSDSLEYLKEESVTNEKILNKVISSLSEKERTLLSMIFSEGKTTHDIAADLNISEISFRHFKSRLLSKIIREINLMSKEEPKNG